MRWLPCRQCSRWGQTPILGTSQWTLSSFPAAPARYVTACQAVPLSCGAPPPPSQETFSTSPLPLQYVTHVNAEGSNAQVCGMKRSACSHRKPATATPCNVKTICCAVQERIGRVAARGVHSNIHSLCLRCSDAAYRSCHLLRNLPRAAIAAAFAVAAFVVLVTAADDGPTSTSAFCV
jgi:hypothetical protein